MAGSQPNSKSFPKELNPEQRRELIVGFVLALVGRCKVAADVALHVGSDPRNLHAHVQLTHREIGPDGFGDIASRHTVMRKGKEIPVAGFVATPRDVIKLRKLWENDVNAAYRKAGLDLTVDSRSYQEQGLDIRPQLYLESIRICGVFHAAAASAELSLASPG